MKLLFCSACRDLFRLTMETNKCLCGACEGHYVDAGNAVYSGKTAIPLGIAWDSFISAIDKQPQSGLGKVFEAFVIPRECPTMKNNTKDGVFTIPVTYVMHGSYKVTADSLEEAIEKVLGSDAPYSALPTNANYVGDSMQIDKDSL